MGNIKLTLHCEYVSDWHIHCNRYTTLSIGLHTSPKDAIEKSSNWGVIDGEIRCEQHR